MKKYLVLQTNGVLKEVHEEDYSSSYEMLKENVEGCIECVSFIKDFRKKGIDLWINEEGKLIDLLPTIAILSDEEIVEILNGNIVFARVNDEGETLPLNDDDIEFIRKTLTKKIGFLQYRSGFSGTELRNMVSFVEM